MRQAPDPRGTHGDSIGGRNIRRIDVYQVNVLGHHGGWNGSAMGCERVLRRNHHGGPETEQCFACQLRRRDRPGTHYADGAAPFEHGLDHGARFDIEFQQCLGKLFLEGGHGGGQSRDWEHDIHGHAQFRFEPTGQTLCAGLEEIDVARHHARIGKQRATLIGQHWKAGAAIEKLHTELSFQIPQRLAYHGLRTPQAPAGGRETAFIRCRNEGANLIQGKTV
jgi:hypothetical protein